MGRLPSEQAWSAEVKAQIIVTALDFAAYLPVCSLQPVKSSAWRYEAPTDRWSNVRTELVLVDDQHAPRMTTDCYCP